MGFHVGFTGYFSLRLCNDPVRAERVASLLVDPRWPWPPCWALFYRIGVVGKHERARKVVGAKGKAVLRDGIVNPVHRKLELQRASVDAENYATAFLHTGQEIHADWFEQPFDVYGKTRGHELPEDSDLRVWVELVHELMVALDVAHAVMPVWPTMTALLSDLNFLSIVLDTRWAQVDLGPPPDFALQRERAGSWRHKLGHEYIRHPRWGNYLRREHLERVGGLDRIRETVKLAKIVELGDLVFLQCTEHPASALTPEGERVRRALEEVLAPIIVPPRPGEQPAAAKP
jgi:hypothetical protein